MLNYKTNKHKIIYILLIFSNTLFSQINISEIEQSTAIVGGTSCEVPLNTDATKYKLALGEVENLLAEKFKPIIHKHPEDYQLGLADYNDIMENKSSIIGVVIGLEKVDPITPDHGSGSHHWEVSSHPEDFVACSYGQGYDPKSYWELDIDDTARYECAETGHRPLYYHCYKYDNYYYLQYWYFFTMNDISDQTEHSTWHEGDWEHVALKIELVDGKYIPKAINFYQHHGGITVDPSQAWWSSSTDVKNYQSIKKGYDEEHTNLNIWIGKNSHGSYNRWEKIYSVRVDVGIDTDSFLENVDYPTLQSIFEYDKLVNMGEICIDEYVQVGEQNGVIIVQLQAHDAAGWRDHNKQVKHGDSPEIPGLAFTGRIGEYWSHDLSPLPFFSEAVTSSPFAPYITTKGGYHEWLLFTDKSLYPGYFGNNTELGVSYLKEINWAEYNIEVDEYVSERINMQSTVNDKSRITVKGYEAKNKVFANNVIEGDGTNGANVLLRAGKSIHLKPGFHTQKGSTFHAYIDSNLIE